MIFTRPTQVLPLNANRAFLRATATLGEFVGVDVVFCVKGAGDESRSIRGSAECGTTAPCGS